LNHETHIEDRQGRRNSNTISFSLSFIYRLTHRHFNYDRFKNDINYLPSCF